MNLANKERAVWSKDINDFFFSFKKERKEGDVSRKREKGERERERGMGIPHKGFWKQLERAELADSCLHEECRAISQVCKIPPIRCAKQVGFYSAPLLLHEI